MWHNSSDVAGAVLSESGARDHRHLLLHEQAMSERLVIEAGGANGGEGIEGAARFEALQPHAVQPVHHDAAAAVVFGRHATHVLLPMLQRLDSGVLARRGGGHHDVLVDLNHRFEDMEGAATQPSRQPVMA